MVNIKRKPSEQSLEIVEYRKKYPCLTMRVIGVNFNLSTERIRQILKRGMVNTKHLTKRSKYNCLNCGKETTHLKYCNRTCFYEYTHPLVECYQCGKLFRRLQGWLYNKQPHTHYFCSRKCNGVFAARNYGFLKHPENSAVGLRKGKSKYEQHLPEIINLLQQGYTLYKISRMLKIPDSIFYAKPMTTILRNNLIPTTKNIVDKTDANIITLQNF